MPRTTTTRIGNGAGQGPAKGPGQGAGWGGPANGAHPERGAKSTFPAGQAFPNLPTDKSKRRAMMSEICENKMFEIVVTSDCPATALNASAKLHAIFNGTPIARTVNATVDDVSQLSDDAIRSELAGIGGTSVATDARDAPAGVSPLTH